MIRSLTAILVSLALISQPASASLRFINSIAILDGQAFATSAGDNNDVMFASSNFQITATNDGDAITGIIPSSGAEDGAQCWLTNASASNTLILRSNSGSSTAGYRFILPGGNLTLTAGSSQHFGLAAGVGWVPISGALVNPAKTSTATATTGAQTINKQAGSVNFAASATSLVVTNSMVSATSIVLATINTNDATMTSVTAVPTSGSFTLRGNAAPAGECRVSFFVIP